MRHKEHILLLPCVVSVLSLVCWIAALIFFFQELTSWQVKFNYKNINLVIFSFVQKYQFMADLVSQLTARPHYWIELT